MIFIVTARPPACCIDLNVYCGGRELFSPKVNPLRRSAEVGHWYKSQADFSRARERFNYGVRVGLIEMTMQTGWRSFGSYTMQKSEFF